MTIDRYFASRWAKPILFGICLAPLLGLVFSAITGGLGANPIETVTRTTGDWALRLLLATLAVTPLRRLFGWNRLLRLRRMLGVYAFFYVALHVTTYVALDQFFSWSAIVADVFKRPYITVGFTAFVLLVPLAITSTDGWMRRLRKGWAKLHRLVYPAALFAVVHFLWLVKADLREPLIYALILAALLGFRLLPRSLQRLPSALHFARRSGGPTPAL